MIRLLRRHAIAAVVMGVFLGVAGAHSDPLSKDIADPQAQLNYWTADRLRHAKPRPLPKRSARAAANAPSAATVSGTPESGEASPPWVNIAPDNNNVLFAPETAAVPDAQPSAPEAVARNAGVARSAYFSSSRLVPTSADRVYPYRVVGKLFFTDEFGPSYCSAFVQKPRIVVTAGHCVHRGSGGLAGFYSNFLFIPAYRRGAAPYQSWRVTHVMVANPWATGGGRVPNPADYGMLEIADQPIGRIIRKIGDVTGFLGYETLALHPNHAHLLGYPGNLDGGELLRQVTAGSNGPDPDGNNTVLYGSDMENGSSGGPWIMNFGVPAAEQRGTLRPPMNKVIGITSYEYPGEMIQGSSILDRRYTGLLNRICAHRAGNC